MFADFDWFILKITPSSYSLANSFGQEFENIVNYIYVIYRAGDPYGKKLCRTQDQGHSFFPIRTDLACSKLVLQSTNGFVYANLVIESACAPSTNDS